MRAQGLSERFAASMLARTWAGSLPSMTARSTAVAPGCASMQSTKRHCASSSNSVIMNPPLMTPWYGKEPARFVQVFAPSPAPRVARIPAPQ